MYDRTTVQTYKVLLLTCVVNCFTGMPMPWICPVVQWSVHWALNRTTLVLVLAGARSGREIVPNTGTNATKFFTLATKS